MGRGPEFKGIEPVPQAQTEGDASISAAAAQPSESLAPHGINWILVDGGRTWGPRPLLTPAGTAREDQNQARLLESIDLHRN